MFVGLTPGRTQAANALEALQAQLKAGRSLEGALAAAKSTASFSGSMRSSLIAMLDLVGVPQKFSRASAAAFFEAGSPLVHFTSTRRYPVYLTGAPTIRVRRHPCPIPSCARWWRRIWPKRPLRCRRRSGRHSADMPRRV